MPPLGMCSFRPTPSALGARPCKRTTGPCEGDACGGCVISEVVHPELSRGEHSERTQLGKPWTGTGPAGRGRSRRRSKRRARSREARLKKSGPLRRDRFLHTLGEERREPPRGLRRRRVGGAADAPNARRRPRS
ncbi:hypothetical protein AKJ08_0966 [Vulgatibacter incomptus]|uniref:Uncharacterized protein n=1 Tax=Vulgatibacter incomptus TaxID=1391653 RepID=A0A0K1PBT2_9BACT|nr:hypothetical protein AKJ08_0966 [Vulgatibacter incomptus]